MDMKLEVVVLPVADVDRAKAFYTGLGWRLDADFAVDADFRVVQVTPPGSPTSVIFGASVTTQEPGTAQELQLIVTDIHAAHDELKRLGAEPSEVFHDAGGVFHHAGDQGRVPGADPQRRRQRLGATGGHHPVPGPPRPVGHPVRVHRRPRGRAAPRGRHPRRARGAHRFAGP